MVFEIAKTGPDQFKVFMFVGIWKGKASYHL
jgi:hypothetical protein